MDSILIDMIIISMEDVSKLRIRIPQHIKIDWTCPNCDKYFDSMTPSFGHEYICPSLSSASEYPNYSHPQKRLRTPLESPKKYHLSHSKPPLAPRGRGINNGLSLF